MVLKKLVKKAPQAPLPTFIPTEKLLGRSGFLLNKAGQRVREVYEEALKPTGLTAKQAGVLMILEERGSLSQQELGKCAYLDRTTVVGLMDDLEKMGLVERKEHPTDRRSHAIYLTPKGKEILPVIDKHAEAMERKFLGCLNAQEQKSLIQTLRKLVLNHFNVSKESR
ncbi:MAG TPA: MarR family transcriptional regulator [bacterium]|nr:MarR family transcriptional regulator [bacterium]